MTASGVVYDRRVGDHTLSFGVSGRLYHSNLLLYDRQTDSLWSQITAEAVAGRLTGAKLQAVPFLITTWQQWQRQSPHTRVLVDRRVPALFSALGQVFRPLLRPFSLLGRLTHPPRQSSLAEMVLGVTNAEARKAYPLDILAQTASPFLTDTLGGTSVRIFFVPHGHFAYAETNEGERLPSVVTYRATWFAFFPHSQLCGADS